MPPEPSVFADATQFRLGDSDRYLLIHRGRSGRVYLTFSDERLRRSWGLTVGSIEWDDLVARLGDYALDDPADQATALVMSDVEVDAVEMMVDAVRVYSARAAEDARKWGERLTAALRLANASRGRTEASEGRA